MSDEPIDHLAIARAADAVIAERRKTFPIVVKQNGRPVVVLRRDTSIEDVRAAIATIGRARHDYATLKHCTVDVDLNGWKILPTDGIEYFTAPKLEKVTPITTANQRKRKRRKR